MNKHAFSKADRAAVYRVINERRDMRHFLPDPVAPDLLQRLIEAAHQAPSVGLMQPWRIIRITQHTTRQAIYELVEQERLTTAKALAEREHDFMQLKVEGIADCGELLIFSLMAERDVHIFGRRTMPEMDLASVSCAIQNMWLAARAEGLGMGWVSLFDPQQLATLLKMPNDASPVAIICLGHVNEFYSAPMLELENWRKGIALNEVIYDNFWGKIQPT